MGQQRALPLELGLRLEPRHVPRDRRGADDLSVDVADRRDLQHDVQHDLVLPHPVRLVLLDLLPAPEPLEDPGQVIGEIWRDEERDRAPDGLRGRVSIHPLCPSVPSQDRPVDVLADDGVVGGFDDRRQLPGSDLLASTLADIADERRGEAPLVGLDCGKRDVDRELAAILAASGGLLVDEHDVSALVDEAPFDCLQRAHGNVDGKLLALARLADEAAVIGFQGPPENAPARGTRSAVRSTRRACSRRAARSRR